MAETTFNYEELLKKYGISPEQQTPESIKAYQAATETAGFEGQLIQGYVPTALGSQFAGTPEHRDLPELYAESLKERSGLPQTGTANQTYAYWDAQRGATVHAPAGSHFELYPGGGVKTVQGLIAKGVPATQAAQPTRTSLFDQPATLQAPGTYAGKEFKKEELAYTPAPGKTIATVGPVYHDDARGVDVHADPGNTFIKNTDGTVEQRPLGSQVPGEAKGKEAFGPSAQELGITRGTEIKGASGEIVRAPQTETVEQIAKRGGSAEEMEQRIAAEGKLAPTGSLTFVGAEDKGHVAKTGNAFYRAPDGTLLERPLALQKFAKQPEAAQQGPSGEELMGQYGVQADSSLAAQRPEKFFEDTYGQLLERMGVPSINAEIAGIQKEMKTLDDQYADDVAAINENPWYTEGVRVGKIRRLQEKYDMKRGQLIDRMKLSSSLLEEAREEARFVTTTALNQYNKEREFALEQQKFLQDKAESVLDTRIKLAQLEISKFQAGKGDKPTSGIQEYLYARSQGYSGSYVEFQRELANLREGSGIGEAISGLRLQLLEKELKEGKPPTASQESTSIYASRLEQSNAIFDQLSLFTDKLSMTTFIQRRLPNILKSSNLQSLQQAERNFLNATLRRESGAVISPTEFAEGRQQYFPQPGDSAQVLQQKKANRDLVVSAFIRASGTAYSPLSQLLPPGDVPQVGSMFNGQVITNVVKIK